MNESTHPRWVYGLGLLAVLSALILVMCAGPGRAEAGWDLLGVGKAAEAVAAATWRVVAIRAIEAGKFVILMGLVIYGLTWAVSRFGELAVKAAQDNVLTRKELVLLAADFALTATVPAICLPVGFKLLEVLLQ